MTENPSLDYWLTLHKLPGVGAHTAGQLLAQFETIESLFETDRQSLQCVLQDNCAAIDAIVKGPQEKNLAREKKWLAQVEHHIVVWDDEDYPPLLKQIPDPPPVLFLIGDKGLLQSTQLAIVGSRNPTPSGAQTARDFAASLADVGLVITSGMALGIDAAAHEGALAADGYTVAIAGTGIDRVYPQQHHGLAHRIAEQGLLLSEFPLGTAPRRQHFPRRNRIISGLCVGTLVVEAALHSGSLITARLAGEQGREVFAIPGSIHSPMSRGCHQLIRQGAKLVETAQDILEELGPLADFILAEVDKKTQKKTDFTTKEQHSLLDYMGHDSITIDALVERSGLTSDRICSMLLQLELAGVVVSTHGGQYQRLA